MTTQAVRTHNDPPVQHEHATGTVLRNLDGTTHVQDGTIDTVIVDPMTGSRTATTRTITIQTKDGRHVAESFDCATCGNGPLAPELLTPCSRCGYLVCHHCLRETPDGFVCHDCAPKSWFEWTLSLE